MLYIMAYSIEYAMVVSYLYWNLIMYCRQWLPRGKLEPLGERPDLDKAKLVESRKPADRKAVKRAYEQAILHRCRVTGDQDALTGGESEEEEIVTAPSSTQSWATATAQPH